jgi:signal transduction histidine kinase
MNPCSILIIEDDSAVAQGPRDGQAVISVTDTGRGIAVEDLSRLFERFRRGRNRAGRPGNGLGLAIVKAIALAHRGSVQVVSAGADQGWRFSILLPLVS